MDDSNSNVKEIAIKNLLKSFDSCKRGAHQHIVTVCPESLRLFQQLFEENANKSFFKVFDSWTSLSSETYSLHLPSVRQVFHSIELESRRLSRLHKFFSYQQTSNVNTNKNSPERCSTTKMMEVHHHLIRNWKSNLDDQVSKKGSMETHAGFTGRNLRIKDVKDCVYVLVHIRVNETLFDQYNSPRVEEIHFKDISSSIQKTDKSVSFLTMCRNLYINKKIIYITFNEKSLVPLLGMGFWVPEVFTESVAGVATIEELLVASKPEFKTKTQDYYQALAHQENFSPSGLGPNEMVKFMQKIFTDLQIESAPRDIIGSTIHLLDSPYINKLFLNSSLDILNEDIVWIKLDVSKANLKPGKSFLTGKVTKEIWNYDDETTFIKVKIFPSCCDKSIRFPEQICEVRSDLKVQVAVMNLIGRTVKKAKLGSEGFLFGYLNFVSKQDFRKEAVEDSADISEFGDYYNKRFGKGFSGFEAEYMQHKRRTKELISSFQCKEYIQYFKNLGFSSMKEVFHQVLFPCKNVASFEEDLFKHLQALVCNDFHNPAEVANILFSSLYAQFVLKQDKKEKFPAIEDLRSELFPKENWIFEVEIDGVLLENSFSYSMKTNNMHEIISIEEDREVIEVTVNDGNESQVEETEVDREVLEAMETEVEVEEIEIKVEPVDTNDDTEIVDGAGCEVKIPENDLFPEPVACSSTEN
eukprot:TRINITY_DN37869_c0_g1_i1.p1 TRINITY_DN37869_c0_g1~~TRINITY_DN37869_c0_g1_i1.p1  ORF type:complete len:747 (-),score=149.27 TRINITY_DN37869_c0_g1_i1:330-2417(-)